MWGKCHHCFCVVDVYFNLGFFFCLGGSQLNLRGCGIEKSPNDVTVNTKGFCVSDFKCPCLQERVLKGIKERCLRWVEEIYSGGLLTEKDFVYFCVCRKHEKERGRDIDRVCMCILCGVCVCMDV